MLTQKSNLNELRKKVKLSLFPVQPNRIPPTSPSRPAEPTCQIRRLAHPSLLPQNSQASVSAPQTKQKFHDFYELGLSIGQGAHGIVRICTKRGSPCKPTTYGLIPTKYAVKQLIDADDPELINTIIQTFNINRSLNSIPQVIKVYDLFIDENLSSASIVMEYFEHPTLLYIMKRSSLTDALVKGVIHQLALCLCAIHAKGVCHRDVKPDNILVKTMGQLQIKLIDFGVSRNFFVQNKNGKIVHEMWTRTGTLLYQAPEIFIGGGYDEKIDIWALGVILYQMLSNHFPFMAQSAMETIELITDPQASIEANPEFKRFSRVHQDLLKRLLQKDPEKRLSAEELLLHPWLVERNHSPSKARDDLMMNSPSTSAKADQLKLASSAQLHEINQQWNQSPLYSNPLVEKKSFKFSDQTHIHHIHKGEQLSNLMDLEPFLKKYKPFGKQSSFELNSQSSNEISPIDQGTEIFLGSGQQCK